MRSQEYYDAYKRRNRLEEVSELIDECYSEVTELEWQQALDFGIYLYEFTYGIDEEFFKGANNKYYVVLPDYQTKCADGYLDSEWTTVKYLEKLAVPEVTVSNYTATWPSVENAVKYLYIINNGEPFETTLLKIEGLIVGDKIKVCAVGDNENYASSDFTNNLTVKQKLNTPVITVDENGLATWTFENDFSSSVLKNMRYYIILNNDENGIITLAETSYQLTAGDTIKVKVFYGRTNGNFEESDWSVEATF